MKFIGRKSELSKLNKGTPHSRYFSDELGVQIFWQKKEHTFTFGETYGIL